MQIQELQKKMQKTFFYFEIIALELVALHSHFYWEISDTTKTEFPKLISFQSDQKIWQKDCRAGLSSLSDRLPCWLSISVLTRSFLGI